MRWQNGLPACLLGTIGKTLSYQELRLVILIVKIHQGQNFYQSLSDLPAQDVHLISPGFARVRRASSSSDEAGRSTGRIDASTWQEKELRDGEEIEGQQHLNAFCQ
jgi:hypothetical protein